MDEEDILPLDETVGEEVDTAAGVEVVVKVAGEEVVVKVVGDPTAASNGSGYLAVSTSAAVPVVNKCVAGFC